MVLAIFAFCGVFLLVASGGLILFYREAMLNRITSLTAQKKKQGGLLDAIQQTGLSLGPVAEAFERFLPKSNAKTSIVQRRLIRAGYRNDAAVRLFSGIKVLLPLSLCAAAWASGVGGKSPFFACAVALGIGYLAPDILLGKLVSKRQSRIRLGLPDVLDLLVICVEAGLGLDQATARAATELSRSQPAISDELGIVVLEQRAGRPRSDAWRNMAERTDVDTVRNLVALLVQSEQFGTSIAKNLRTHSEILRTQRVQLVEERAAKTTVKLLFPLVLFIFPCLFLVTLGPAMILMSESFKKFLTH